MQTARIIAKGTLAEVAAEAATYSIFIIGKPISEVNLLGNPEIVATVYSGLNGSEPWHLEKRLNEWFSRLPLIPPFPAGTLLWFTGYES